MQRVGRILSPGLVHSQSRLLLRHGSGAAGHFKPVVGPGSTAYSILGVTPEADLAQLKSSYRTLARQWHPDTGRESGGEEIFPAISSSYKILTDPSQRVVYDRLYEENFIPLLRPKDFESFWDRSADGDRMVMVNRMMRTIHLVSWGVGVGILAIVLLIRRPRLVEVAEQSPEAEPPQDALLRFAPLGGLACGAGGALGAALSGRKPGWVLLAGWGSGLAGRYGSHGLELVLGQMRLIRERRSRWLVANSRPLGELTGVACAVLAFVRSSSGSLPLARKPIRLLLSVLAGMAGGNVGARLACSEAEVNAAAPMRAADAALAPEATPKTSPPAQPVAPASPGPSSDPTPPKTTITAF